MRNKFRRGNLLLTFLLLTGLSAVVGSLSFLTVTEIKNVSYTANRTRALYIAEAGMQKAMWELSTPVAYGGQGINWRTDNFTESFGGGSYTLRISDTGSLGQLIVTSEGTSRGITRILEARYGTKYVLPPPFNYALFWNNSEASTDRLEIGGIFFNANINGDCYGNGNFDVKTGSGITDGKLYLPTGFDVTGDGAYASAEVSSPIPFPTLNNSYYIGRINRYNNLITSVPFVVYAPPSNNNVITLEGNSLGYINLDVPSPGSLTIYGSGEIVVKTNINIKGTLRIYPASGETIALIAKNSITIDPVVGFVAKLFPGAHLYSKNGECLLAGISGSTLEAHAALIMSGARVTLNWPGTFVQDNSIIYIPPQAVGIKKLLETQYFVGDISFASTDIFHGSLICDCSDVTRYIRIAGGGLRGIIYSRISPLKLILVDVEGSVVADKIEYLFGQRALSGDIQWAPSFLPSIPPPGLSVEAVSFVPLTWQELHP